VSVYRNGDVVLKLMLFWFSWRRGESEGLAKKQLNPAKCRALPTAMSTARFKTAA